VQLFAHVHKAARQFFLSNRESVQELADIIESDYRPIGGVIHLRRKFCTELAIDLSKTKELAAILDVIVYGSDWDSSRDAI
jgi:hypothetical protein